MTTAAVALQCQQEGLCIAIFVLGILRGKDSVKSTAEMQILFSLQCSSRDHTSVPQHFRTKSVPKMASLRDFTCQLARQSSGQRTWEPPMIGFSTIASPALKLWAIQLIWLYQNIQETIISVYERFKKCVAQLSMLLVLSTTQLVCWIPRDIQACITLQQSVQDFQASLIRPLMFQPLNLRPNRRSS